MLEGNEMITLLKPDDLRQIIKAELQKVLEDNFDKLAKQTPDKKETPEMLTDKELADRLKMSRVTLYEWRRKGILPFKRIGKRVLYNWDDVYKTLKDVKQRDKALQG